MKQSSKNLQLIGKENCKIATWVEHHFNITYATVKSNLMFSRKSIDSSSLDASSQPKV